MLLSLVDARWNAETTVKSGYVLLCGDYLPSLKGYYHLLMLDGTLKLQSKVVMSSCVGIIFNHGKLLT